MISWDGQDRINNLHWKEAVMAAVEGQLGQHLNQGEAIRTFEANWANFCDAAACVATNSGTQAIELAVRAVVPGQGRRVVTPAHTFWATTASVVRAGHQPVFVDCDPRTGLINEDKAVELAQASAAAAIVTTAVGGQSAEISKLRQAGVPIIEDAAPAAGSMHKGQRVGGIADVTSWSFNPQKNLGAIGSAGAVTFASRNYRDEVRTLRNHGRPEGLGLHTRTDGTNGYMDSIQAAVLNAKLPHLYDWNARRREIAEYYTYCLEPDWTVTKARTHNISSWFVFQILGIANRDAIRNELFEAGIETRLHWGQSCDADAPVADWLGNHAISIPVNAMLSDAEVEKIVDTLKKIHKKVDFCTPSGL